MERIKTYSANQVSEAIAKNSSLMLVHFGSPLASTCEFVRRELELLADEFEGRILFAEVELPLQDLELIHRYEIEDIPTLILFLGDKEVERLDQVLAPEELRELLESSASFYSPNPTPDAPAR
ncbi:MAG: thioredoxin family protein [Planctomycetota bacterium]